MVKELAKSFDGRQLFDNFNIHLRAGDRVAIIGPNGVGKSTLLNIIARQQTPDKGLVNFGANVDMGYYEQHQTKLNPDKDILNELWDDFPRLEIDRVRGVLALFLFIGEDVFQPIHTLSGGEKGRVSLAKLMLRHDNFLLMDEPTNHLDMDSREVLEDALEDFDGTILTVSHDRYFINRVANRVVEMTADGVKEYIGNYDDYLEKKRLEEAGIEEEAFAGKTKTQIDKEKRKVRLAKESEKALRLKLKNCENDIAATEEKIALLEEKMGDPDTYKDQELAQQVAKDHRDEQEKLDELYELWEELSEAVAELE
jgi:ATP-binding cassette subfamily F protein 3